MKPETTCALPAIMPARSENSVSVAPGMRLVMLPVRGGDEMPWCSSLRIHALGAVISGWRVVHGEGSDLTATWQSLSGGRFVLA